LAEDTEKISHRDTETQREKSKRTHIFALRDGKVVGFEERGDVSALVAEIRSAQAML
jgi:hypothetical protein